VTPDTPSSQFFLDVHMEAATAVSIAGGEAAVMSLRSPEHEEGNEDAVAIIPVSETSGVLALADGMGGHANGAKAARLALEAIDASVRGRDPEEELRTSILNGFEMANETVRALGVGAGTTLAVAEIQGQWIRTYHVGDSGVVVVGQRGSVRTRTVDHSPTGYGLEAGLMDEHEAIHHEERHILSNAVGAKDMRIDVGSSVQMGMRDTILLASDGLFDNLVLDSILDRIRTGPVTDGVLDLCRAARRRMTRPSETQPSKPDDLTIVAFRRPPTS
jgi:serine/threonine protein phosphatase PrpC